jgi:hypothetical protein
MRTVVCIPNHHNERRNEDMPGRSEISSFASPLVSSMPARYILCLPTCLPFDLDLGRLLLWLQPFCIDPQSDVGLSTTEMQCLRQKKQKRYRRDHIHSSIKYNGPQEGRDGACDRSGGYHEREYHTSVRGKSVTQTVL